MGGGGGQNVLTAESRSYKDNPIELRLACMNSEMQSKLLI